MRMAADGDRQCPSSHTHILARMCVNCADIGAFDRGVRRLVAAGPCNAQLLVARLLVAKPHVHGLVAAPFVVAGLLATGLHVAKPHISEVVVADLLAGRFIATGLLVAELDVPRFRAANMIALKLLATRLLVSNYVAKIPIAGLDFTLPAFMLLDLALPNSSLQVSPLPDSDARHLVATLPSTRYLGDARRPAQLLIGNIGMSEFCKRGQRADIRIGKTMAHRHHGFGPPRRIAMPNVRQATLHLPRFLEATPDGCTRNVHEAR